MIVRALEATDADLIAAARRLERGRPGYGLRLFAEYRAVLANVERFPQMYPSVDDGLPGRDFRNALLSRLNYRVVYEVREAEVLIVAVLYTGRRPELWHNRTEE